MQVYFCTPGPSRHELCPCSLGLPAEGPLEPIDDDDDEGKDKEQKDDNDGDDDDDDNNQVDAGLPGVLLGQL